MSRYKVIVVDNFNDMDEDERYELGTFSTLEEAVAACKKIVDEDLIAFAKNYTPAELYDCYTSWGSDPFIIALNPKDETPRFSAWEYANERCLVLAAHAAGQS